jgi:hypothetical protein
MNLFAKRDKNSTLDVRHIWAERWQIDIGNFDYLPLSTLFQTNWPSPCDFAFFPYHFDAMVIDVAFLFLSHIEWRPIASRNAFHSVIVSSTASKSSSRPTSTTSSYPRSATSQRLRVCSPIAPTWMRFQFCAPLSSPSFLGSLHPGSMQTCHQLDTNIKTRTRPLWQSMKKNPALVDGGHSKAQFPDCPDRPFECRRVNTGPTFERIGIAQALFEWSLLLLA